MGAHGDDSMRSQNGWCAARAILDKSEPPLQWQELCSAALRKRARPAEASGEIWDNRFYEEEAEAVMITEKPTLIIGNVSLNSMTSLAADP